jgi:clan AA aspartic protease (TIGR02281 family)
VLTIRCHCGEVYHAEESHLGKALKCSKCDNILRIEDSNSGFFHSDDLDSNEFKKERFSLLQRATCWWGKITPVAIASVLITLFALSNFPQVKKHSAPPAQVPGPQVPFQNANGTPKGVSLADMPAPQIIRLKSGTNILPAIGSPGPNKLRIRNGTNYDAAVSLRDLKADIERRRVYVKAGEDITIDGIGPHRSQLLVSLGTNWNRSTNAFWFPASHFVFADPLPFDETGIESGIKLKIATVTLHGVPEGKATTVQMSKEDFEKSRGRRVAESEQLSANVAPRSIPMVNVGGIYSVRVVINNVITRNFMIDSGAADVSISADVASTLVSSGTLSDADFTGIGLYQLADGSTMPSRIFTIKSLKVGDKVIENVTGSVSSAGSPLLLGQSFLRRFKSWSIDNSKHALMLE